MLDPGTAGWPYGWQRTSKFNVDWLPIVDYAVEEEGFNGRRREVMSVATGK